MEASYTIPPTVLVVEDSDEDFAAFARACRRTTQAVKLVRCVDGDDAFDLLYGQGAYAGDHKRPRPALIVLDLNLPGMDGRDVLKFVKHDHRSNLLPVIVLTTSSNPADVETCYRHGASGYLVKAVDFDIFVQAIDALCTYWFHAMILPETAGAA